MLKKILSPLKNIINYFVIRILKIQRLQSVRNFRSINDYRNEILNSCHVIFDVGSCGGNYLGCINNLSSKNIYSFEPDKLIFAQLQKRFEKNKNINFFNIGLDTKSGQRDMFCYAIPTLNSLYSISEFFKKRTKFIEKKTIDCQSLDEFISINRIQQIDILNIDTNGSEISILEGAKNSLSMGKFRNIEISILSPNIYNVDKNHIPKLLNLLMCHDMVLSRIFFEPVDFEITKYTFLFSSK